MFPGFVLDKRLVAVEQVASGVMSWESPLNNAGYAVGQDKTKGQQQVIGTRGLRNKLAQIVVTGASVAPTINMEGSMDGATWVQLATVNAMAGGSLASTDDYPQTRINVTAYTDGTITGRFEARE